MILGIGVDVVQVSRFEKWLEYPKEQLFRIFSQNELDEIFSGSNDLAMQRMASRYAAKEAFYKALSASLVRLKQTQKEIPFLSTCKSVSVKISQLGIPEFVVNWEFFEEKLAYKLPQVELNLSISHEKDYAIAYVIIQEKKTA